MTTTHLDSNVPADNANVSGSQTSSRLVSVLVPPDKRLQMIIGMIIGIVGLSGLLFEYFELKASVNPGDMGQLLVLNRDVSAGERLHSGDLSVAEVPLTYAHRKAVSSEQRTLVEERLLRDGVQRGEVLLWSALAAEHVANSRLASRILPGERAVAIQVDAVASVNHFVQPGDRVDLFLSTRQHGNRIVMPVLQNVVILAVGHALPGDVIPDSYGRIVVSVTPQEAELLLLAQQAGKIDLLLRHPDDFEAKADFPILRESEFVASDLRKNIQKQRNIRTVKVIRGSG